MATVNPLVSAAMRKRVHALALAEGACWVAGVALVAYVALAKADAMVAREQDVAEFARQLAAPDQSLWSDSRIRDYRAALQVADDEPVAVLSVRSIKLEVPVYAHDDELSLNRGAGLIADTGLPDRGGNVGMAGHRDGYFRALKGIRLGDLIEVRTRARLHRYRVTSIKVVEQADARALADTELPTITLVTCYPFYFLGNAPQRFVVSGSYVWDET
jgi:sortase A